MQPIIQHLFQASSLGEVSRQRLESFVQDYPSFGIGHYLLSRKLREEGAGNYMEETRKTSLYFSNPFWLQWLLESGEEMGQPAPAARTHTPSPVPEVVPEPAFHEEPAPETGSVVSLAEEALVHEEPATETGSVVTLAEAAAAVDEPTAAELLLQSIQEAKGLRHSLNQINEDFNIGKPLPEEPIHDEEPPFVLDEETSAEETSIAPVEAAPAAEPALVFEPYHTIDYFASQGIRLNIEENPGDQLGKQLKSFTDWLKMMRRLPQKDREIVPDRVAEQTVQTIAAHSVVGREVVTETMAEVLAKQGMPERARAVYEKLSLLNPDKRAYFATKIEQLNHR
ncbi:MAG TPA: hypothetical protein VI233_07865 [Puia sp.]